MKPVLRVNLYFLVILIISIFAPKIVNPTINGVTINPLMALIIKNIIIFIIPIIIYIKLTKSNLKRILMLDKPSYKDIFRAILIGVLAQPIVRFCYYLSSLFYSNQEILFLERTNNYPLWLVILMAALIPSIVEDLTVRGVVLSGYSYKSKGIAAFMTAIMYAMLNLNPSKFLYALVIGVILAYMVRATGSIIISIICHFIINTIQIILQRINTMNLTTEDITNKLEAAKHITITAKISSLIFYLALAVIFAMIIMRIIRSMEKDNLNIYLDDLDTETKIACKHEEVVNIPFIISVLVFIIYITYNFYMTLGMV